MMDKLKNETEQYKKDLPPLHFGNSGGKARKGPIDRVRDSRVFQIQIRWRYAFLQIVCAIVIAETMLNWTTGDVSASSAWAVAEILALPLIVLILSPLLFIGDFVLLAMFYERARALQVVSLSVLTLAFALAILLSLPSHGLSWPQLLLY